VAYCKVLSIGKESTSAFSKLSNSTTLMSPLIHRIINCRTFSNERDRIIMSAFYINFNRTYSKKYDSVRYKIKFHMKKYAYAKYKSLIRLKPSIMVVYKNDRNINKFLNRISR